MNDLIWLVKREFWEHRGGFFWAPVVAGGVFLAIYLMGIITGEVLRSSADITLDLGGIDYSAFVGNLTPERQDQLGLVLDASLLGPGGLIGIVMFVVLLFYCVGCLSDDRRDRSILFWKSLPVSDRDTVLSKVVSATIIVPVIAVAVSIACGLLLFLMMTITAAFHGVNLLGALWELGHPLRTIFTLIAMIPVGLVWALPTVGWLMLCSAAARSKPFLWALALPVGAGVMVSWFGLMNLFGLEVVWFWKNIVARAYLGVAPASWMPGNLMDTVESLHEHDVDSGFGALQTFFSLGHQYAQILTPAFLIGAVAGIGMIAAAIWFRRWRTEM